MLEILLSFIYILIFLIIIGKMSFFKMEKVSAKTFQLLFLIKIGAAVLLYMIYTRFYPDREHADIFKYYDDSAIIYNAAFSHPLDFIRMFTGLTANSRDLWHYYDAMHNWFNSEMIFNDSRTMIRLNTLLRFFSFGTYFPHAIIMSFLAMMGLTGIFKVFTAVLPGREFFMSILVYLLPSTLLWSSGMIKEAFLIFSIGMLIYCIHIYLADRKLNTLRIAGTFFFGFSLLCIKSYVLFAIIPGIVTWIICEKWRVKKVATALIVHGSYLLILFNVAFIFTHHSVPILLSTKQNEFYLVAIKEQAKSMIHLNQMDGTISSLIKNIPGAFAITLFRPYLVESKNPLIVIAAFENAFILLFLIICILGLRKNWNYKMPSVFYLCIYFSIIIFVLIGLVTPILGAIVRYKVPALTFLLFAFFCLTKSKWVNYRPEKLNGILFFQ